MKPSSSSAKSAKQAGVQVRKYLASRPPDSRNALKKLRQAIRAAAPSATDAFSYGIPAFRFDGKIFIWYAGWKEHSSIYPMTAVIRRALEDELEGYEMSEGTIRFPLDKPPPVTLVKRIVKARVSELRAKKGKA